MRILLFGILLLHACTSHLNSIDEESHYLKSNEVQIATPQVNFDTQFFKDSLQIRMDLNLEGVEIFYQDNSGKTHLYKQPITIYQSQILKIQAKKKGLIDSDIETIQLVKQSNKIKGAKINLQPLAHDNYPGNGPKTLIDFKKGDIDFKKNNAWLGFDSKSIMIDIELAEAESIETIYISLLQDHNSWIFLPENIQIYLDNTLKLEKTLSKPAAMQKATNRIIKLSINDSKTKKIGLHFQSLNTIPNWHPGVGNQPWLFIDEILIE